MKLDAFDVKILTLLQRDGRMTKLKLAENIHLSPSPCWERLRRLEEAGLIRGYHAEIDIERLVHISTVLVEVTLKSHHAEDFERFETVIQAVPEIMECYATGGGFDYLLKIVTVDIDHYQRLIDSLLEADIGIEKYYTYVVTKRVKRSREYPIQKLMGTEWKAEDSIS